MKKTIIRTLMFVSVFVMSFLISNTDTQAASKKWEKACKAYKTFLAKNESKFKVIEGDFETKNKENYKKTKAFMIVDLDRNGIPELVTCHEKGYKAGYLYFFEYKKGKVQKVKDKKGNAVSVDITCTAQGYYSIYKCKKGHLHANWYGGWYGFNNTTYRMSKGKLQTYLNYTQDDIQGFTSITEKGKKISKKKYNSIIAKCGSKQTCLVYNNKTNRKKYCK